MTDGNGKPLIDRISNPDWVRKDINGPDASLTAANDRAAPATTDWELTVSSDARMAHELVSLFLSIDDPDVRERCLSFVREQALGSAN